MAHSRGPVGGGIKIILGFTTIRQFQNLAPVLQRSSRTINSEPSMNTQLCFPPRSAVWLLLLLASAQLNPGAVLFGPFLRGTGRWDTVMDCDEWQWIMVPFRTGPSGGFVTVSLSREAPYQMGAMVRACSFAVSSLQGNRPPERDVQVITGSTFDQGAEGWTAWTARPEYKPTVFIHATGGDPGGFIRCDEYQSGDGATTYWQAPAKFLGNKGVCFGGYLEFALRQNSLNSQYDTEDIVLEGDGIRLVYDTPYNPARKWTAYRVPLFAKGWRVGGLNGPAATDDQFRRVLGSLVLFRIRAEFEGGNDVDDLDTVLFQRPHRAKQVVALGR